MRKKLCIILVFCSLICIGCSSNNDTSKDGLISYMEAKEMIINDNAMLLDVRTEEEYDEDHIAGALSLALEEISIDTVSNIIDDKEKEIIVYCNNGTRSSEAKIKLEELGYANVYDLGAMTNWKE